MKKLCAISGFKKVVDKGKAHSLIRGRVVSRAVNSNLKGDLKVLE